ncbi:DUF1566 domain-containing protein [Crocinitomix algicola]|uniref:DUF1566 domain-containing protein n=1 Tax=Crocinitomix algicola TaxID=1740263 RepID=UPI00082A4C85|nr:DUF1566 domain-containing protein [Crocinitomix algicola]
MKKILYTLLTILSFSQLLFAQSPNKLSYQAVIRNADNNLVNNETVGTQISIIQGSPDGTIIYQETHSPTTNPNGLISLEIGTGAIVTGEISTIDWSEGPYFIQAETDPTGGMDYSISGVSELMSVPYSFYSTVADSIAGGIVYEESDPIFDASLAAGITESDTMYWNDKVDSTDIADMGFITETVGRTYEIGDFAQGGVVVWVDETGQHGIVCAKNDIVGTYRWFSGSYGRTRADGNGPLAGKMNTSLIISGLLIYGDDGGDYAAALCNELVKTEDGISYADWYLPSMEELELISVNRELIDATATANGGTAIVFSPYWSSTESVGVETDAQAKVMTPDGSTNLNTNKAATFNIRPFRTF